MSDSELSALRRASLDDPSLLARLAVEEARAGIVSFLPRLEEALRASNDRCKSRALGVDHVRSVASSVLGEGRVWAFASGGSRKTRGARTCHLLVVEDGDSVWFAFSLSKLGFEAAWRELIQRLPEYWKTASDGSGDRFGRGFDAVRSFRGFHSRARAMAKSDGPVGAPTPMPPGTWRTKTFGDATKAEVDAVDEAMRAWVREMPEKDARGRPRKVAANRHSVGPWCLPAPYVHRDTNLCSASGMPSGRSYRLAGLHPYSTPTVPELPPRFGRSRSDTTAIDINGPTVPFE